MTKDELSEALAHALHAAMSDKPNPSCRFCRYRVNLLMPVVVAFVAEWLRAAAEERTCTSAAVEEWLADMGGEMGS